MTQNTFASFLVASCLTLFAPPAWAGYLQGFSGNGQEATTTNDQITADFAVLDRSAGASSPGDTFGTGFAGFDNLAHIDTTARYLYLYQQVASTTSANPFVTWSGFLLGGATNQFATVTSSAVWNLALTDNNGIVSPTNQFGVDGQPFLPSHSSNLGVTSPSVSSPGAETLISVNPSLTPNLFSASFTLTAGHVTELFGFTTNTPPAILPAGPPSPNLATGAIAGPENLLPPASTPEPSAFVLAAIALAGMVTLRRNRKA